MGKRVNEAKRFRKLLPEDVEKVFTLTLVRLCQGTKRKLISSSKGNWLHGLENEILTRVQANVWNTFF